MYCRLQCPLSCPPINPTQLYRLYRDGMIGLYCSRDTGDSGGDLSFTDARARFPAAEVNSLRRCVRLCVCGCVRTVWRQCKQQSLTRFVLVIVDAA
jgi:hypothetical protein